MTETPAARELADVVTKTLLDEGAGPGGGLHSWRCEYPDRYGECDCVAETAREVVTALLPFLAEREAAARSEALREAADHFDRFDEVTIGGSDIGSNMIPVAPAERLRNMAAALTTGAPDA